MIADRWKCVPKKEEELNTDDFATSLNHSQEYPIRDFYKKMLNIKDGLVSKEHEGKLYPWHLPNTTTSADYENED